MKSPQLTPADIGAWLLKFNPEYWDIINRRASGRPINSWRLFPTYRVGLVRPHQPVVLWVTGSGRRGAPAPGIHMAGYTITRPTSPDQQGDEYWLDEDERRKRRPYVGIQLWDVSTISRERLVSDLRTARMEVLRAPQISNPSYLSRAEREVVEEMIGGWPGRFEAEDAAKPRE